MCLPWGVSSHGDSAADSADRSWPHLVEPVDVWAVAERVARRDFEVEREQFEQAERRLQGLADRLAGSRAAVSVSAVETVTGRCDVVGANFFVVVSASGTATCVLSHAVDEVVGLSPQLATPAANRVNASVASWLQDWLGLPARVCLLSGRQVTGVLSYLYRDHLVLTDRVARAIPYSSLATVALA